MSLVDILDVAPSILVDLRYATDDNFTGKAVYPPNARALVRKEVANELAKIQAELRRDGLGLKIWDAYRPFSVQEKFWKQMPDPLYLAQPIRGSKGEMLEGSMHSRGVAVDLTLVDSDGNNLEMPTEFDDFSERAHRTNQKATERAKANRTRLEQIMTKHGFKGLASEWWHFDWHDSDYPLSDEPIVVSDDHKTLH